MHTRLKHVIMYQGDNMNEYNRMIQGKLYTPNDKTLHEKHNRSRTLQHDFNNKAPLDFEGRRKAMESLIGRYPKSATIEPPFHCDYGENIVVGEHFYANVGCTFLDVGFITIGDNVMIGPSTQLYTASHPIDQWARRQYEYAKPITIGNDVWIGGNVTINPGVTIGDNTIIGSGAVVVKDVPSGVIAAGNPCKVIREITKDDQRYWQELVNAREEPADPVKTK